MVKRIVMADDATGELPPPVETRLLNTIAEGVDAGIVAANIPDQVQDGIADSPTVQAAIAAGIVAADIPGEVSDAVIDLDLAEVATDATDADWEWSLAFAGNREVAVGRRGDGTYFPESMNPSIADTSLEKTAYDQGFVFSVRYEDDDEIAFGVRNDGTTYPATGEGGGSDTATPVVIHGDSLTAAWSTSALASTIGRSVLAVGNGGQSSFWIAARQGGEPLLLTLTGNTLPASGSVACTIAYKTQVGTTTPTMPSGTFAGIVAGIPVALEITGLGTGTITRDTAGRAMPVSPGTHFITGLTYRTRYPIIWAGRNNFKLTGDITQIVNDVRAMLAWSEFPSRALVLSIPPWVGEEIGTGVRGTLDATNAALAAAFPAAYEDTSARLRSSELLTAVGVTATATDLQNITDGLTPESLRLPADAGHLNATGYAALNILVNEIYQARGWAV